MKIKYAKKFEKDNSYIITGLSDEGIDCYYQIEVIPEKLNELLVIPEGRKIKVTDFGEVIKKSYGFPPE